MHGMQEVTGSIPVISTRKKSTAQKCAVLFVVSAGLNSLSHDLCRDSYLPEGAFGMVVMFPAKE